MNIKTCLECKRKFYKKDCKKEGAWAQKKFCSNSCKFDYHNKRLDKLKDSTHDKTLLVLNKEIKGKINFIQSKPINENCDIETENINYEIEVYCNIHKWNKKYNRYMDKNKKHILIITIDPRLYQYFDEIKTFNLKNF